MTAMSDLAPVLQEFFTRRLVSQRDASPATITAYRDTFRLLIVFAAGRAGKAPSALSLADLDAPAITAFLQHLQDDRGNSVRTRNARLPAIRPRYLMGVGVPPSVVDGVRRGVDMFDCVLPTRNGRTGQAFTSRGKLNVKNAQWTRDTRPLDESCACSVCRRHTRAYLRHLYLTGEMLASILLTHHNLAFILDTMKRVRQAIRSAQFAKFRREFTEQLHRGLE